MTLHWLARTKIFKCLLRWTSSFLPMKDRQLFLSDEDFQEQTSTYFLPHFVGRTEVYVANYFCIGS